MSAARMLAGLLVCSCAGAKQPAVSKSVVDEDLPEHKFDEEVARHRHEEWRRFKESAAAFKVADGVDKSEAEFLGEAYFTWQLGGCGAPAGAEDEGNEWRMPVRFGVAGRRLPDPIRVDKATGVVSYAKGPFVEPSKLIDIERKRLEEEMRHWQ